jgi:hypothetical protein
MTWQTDYVAEKLAAWLAWTVAERATNSRGVAVHLDANTARYIIETVIWEYEQCALSKLNAGYGAIQESGKKMEHGG